MFGELGARWLFRCFPTTCRLDDLLVLFIALFIQDHYFANYLQSLCSPDLMGLKSERNKREATIAVIDLPSTWVWNECVEKFGEFWIAIRNMCGFGEVDRCIIQ